MEQKIYSGLNPTKKDSRDKKYKHSKYFGSVSLSSLPKDFTVAEPLEIKDQGIWNICYAFASCSVSEDQEGVTLCPEYVSAKYKEYTGDPLEQWGGNLRDTCKVHIKIGAIQQKDKPFETKGKPETQVVDPKNYPKELDTKALTHRKKSYFNVDGGAYTAFDNVRVALWQHKDDPDKKSVFSGVDWYYEFSDVSGGIIPNRRFEGSCAGHAIKIFGWKDILGVPYLMIQNSWGAEKGDKGIYYIGKETFNQVYARYGAFMFIDRTLEDLKNEISIIQQLINLLQQLLFMIQNNSKTLLGICKRLFGL